jgi:hypothetical protein
MTVKEFIDVMALNEKIVNIDMRFEGCKSTISLVWEYKGEREISIDDIECFGDCSIIRMETDHDITYSDDYEPYVTNIDVTFIIYIDYEDENIKPN